MGLAVVERRAGTVVWVQSKKNDSWWPGIVVDRNDLHVSSRREDEAPVKLLGTTRFNNPPLEWLNLEKSRHIKAFRSEEFNNCISKVNQTQYPMEDTRLVAAIREALQLEEEMQQKFKKRKARDDTLKATLPCQQRKNKGHSKNGNAEQKPKSNSFSKKSPCLAQEEKLKRKQNISYISNGLKQKSFSRCGETMKKPINNGKHYVMDEKLIDVELKVQAKSIGNHVPLVSLVSKLNGKAIIGYPINIESGPKVRRNSEIIATRLKLVRKKRTPVCYVSKNEYSPDIKTEKNYQGSGPVVASCVPLTKIFSEIRRAFG